MKRKIIKIDASKCNGCGLCIPNCPEGALQILDGKARLVSELSCDGLGACLGHCPQGAISVEEREAEPYNEQVVMDSIVKAGPDTLKAHLKHLAGHNEKEYLRQALDYLREKNISVPQYQASAPCCPGGGHHGSPKPQPAQSANSHAGHHHSGGCPGSRAMDFRQEKDAPADVTLQGPVPSQLRQWPVQLALLNPHAPYFQNADLLIAADCVPFALGNFHSQFLKDKVVIIFCPKLDSAIDDYVEKLTTILSDNTINSITITRMEVPCCSGTTRILQAALARSGKAIPVKETVISLKGEVLS